MCFKLNKKIKELQSSVNELTNIVKSQELIELRKQSEELKKIQKNISQVHLKVKDVKMFDGEELGQYVIRITYEQPVVKIKIDDNIIDKIFFIVVCF